MASDTGLSLESFGIEQPYSLQAEQSVLGAALLDPASSVDMLIQKLRPEMFFVRQNRAIFTEIVTLVTNSMPVDVVVLSERLRTESSFGGTDAKVYLTELVETVPSLSNLPHYIEIVHEKYIKRQLMEQAREILEQATDDVESKVMLESAEQRLYEIRSGRDTSDSQLLKYAILDIMTHLQRLAGPDREEYLGIPTGYSVLDRKLTGLGRSDLVILASRPGMGKTSFALNIAVNVAKKNIPVMFFSLEMSTDQLAGRILSSEALVDSKIFRSGVENDSDWEDLTKVSEILGPLPIHLDDTAAITIPEMKSKIRRVSRSAMAGGQKPIGMVVIDYLQLMSGSGRRNENRVQEISEITRNLKIMAKDLNIPVIALSQLSRSAEKGKADHMPALSDLRDSGSIEQDADIVLFLYREAYYDDGPDVSADDALCIIAKNRHGETGKVQMRWDGLHTKYVEVEYGRDY